MDEKRVILSTRYAGGYHSYQYTSSSLLHLIAETNSQIGSLSNKYDIDIFFADPVCPGQRGLNEHSNGLLRRHGLLKQMDFGDLSQNVLSAIADKRNRIPRKFLNYQKPYQVFLSNINGLT